ncbi:hypothetical protein AgCh_010301 [Apium graveolens]
MNKTNLPIRKRLGDVPQFSRSIDAAVAEGNGTRDNPDPRPRIWGCYTFSIVSITNELDGGFLSLEEIDESAYGLEIPKFEEVKSKKRKGSESGNVGGDDEEGVGDVEDEGECGGEEDKELKSTNKKMKKRSRKKKKVEEKWEVAKVVAVLDVPEEDAFEDGEFYAWNELRLHPLIMKSIYRLKFKEPTPIQKACIPAPAHQGKVNNKFGINGYLKDLQRMRNKASTDVSKASTDRASTANTSTDKAING